MPGKRWTAVAAIAAVVMLAGCSPDPEPTPTPTGFASEAEAFAAAEETYRAYVEAGNEVDLSDPSTFEPLFAWTTGELNELDREAYSELHADGTEVSGSARVISVEPQQWDADSQHATLNSCLDVSGVSFSDTDGNPISNPDREPVLALSVTVVATGHSPTGLQVARVEGREGVSQCAP